MKQQYESNKALFEFLIELIDIQIKKYAQLAQIGVGPDARLNSALVRNEVNELIDSAKQLFASLDTHNPELFATIVKQATFYLQCEYKRSYSSILLDANNIHGAAFERIQIQMEAINKIKQQANLGAFPEPFDNPATEVQKQCRYESCHIVIKALQLAIDIQADPAKTWDKALVPEHAQTVLKKNQKEGRYIRLAGEIANLSRECKHIVQELEEPAARIEKTTPERASVAAVMHRLMLNKLFLQYQQKEPKSSLFARDKIWFEVGKEPSKNQVGKNPSENIDSSCRFFVKIAVPVLLLGSLMAWFLQRTEECSPTPGLQ